MKNIIFAAFMLSVITVAFGQEGEFHLNKEYKMKSTGTLDLSSSDAKVFITGSQRSTAHVKIDRRVITRGWSNVSEFRVDVEETEGNLRIREYQSGASVSVGYYSEEYKIEIALPEGASLQISGDDGDYWIKNVNGSVAMSIDDADAELTDCKGSEFRFRLDDGDVRMNQGRGSLTVDADDADVEIYQASFTSIDADVDDGDFIVETSLADDGNYRFTSEDGFISLAVLSGGGEFTVRHDDGSIMAGGDFKTTYESEDETRMTLPSGKAKVSVRADDARVRLSTRN